MRPAVPITIAFLAVACGPAPDAHLPGGQTRGGTGGIFEGSGGAGTGGIGVGGSPLPSGGSDGHGGATVPGSGGIGTGAIGAGGIGAGGSKPVSGGASGSTSSGGAGGANPFDTGGAAGRGTGGGPGGSTAIGSGGKGSGGSTSTGQGGAGGGPVAGAEPCSPPTDVWGSTSHEFKTTNEVCMRTQDDITGTNWNCSSFTGWTLKINGKATECGSAMPAKTNGFLYFNAIPGPGAQTWAAIYWFNAVEHPGPYPPWPGGTSGVTDASVATDSPGGG